MRILTRALLSLALIGGLFASGPAVSLAHARGRLAPASAPLRTHRPRRLVIPRLGAPSISFADDGAIADYIADTDTDLAGFERALARDLAAGNFRAPRTKQLAAAAAAASTPAAEHPRATAAERSAALRSRLSSLESALLGDLRAGAFHGPHTSSAVSAGLGESTDETGAADEVDVAHEAVALSDVLYRLKMQFELDLHAHNVKAVETHFYIDGRRWRVN